jgi:Fur family ferric uptake transcriptional regulator
MAVAHQPQQKQEVRDRFRRFLHGRGIKYTRPRQAILDAVLQMHEHFEAEQVLGVLHSQGHRVGKATVYRTLPLLVDCGILKRVRFDTKQAHYEHAHDQEPHDHMICVRCGSIVEFASAAMRELRQRIGKEHHFHAVSHRLQITGLCWECSINCPVAKVDPQDLKLNRRRIRD